MALSSKGSSWDEIDYEFLGKFSAKARGTGNNNSTSGAPCYKPTQVQLLHRHNAFHRVFLRNATSLETNAFQY
ncbi:hypothetical protein CR513_37199, partial [Mucuna pruriens]